MTKRHAATFLATVVFFQLGSAVLKAEQVDPSKDLKYDIEVLSWMLGIDLSQYPAPPVEVMSKKKFDALTEKISKEAGDDFFETGGRLSGYTACGEDQKAQILVSGGYTKTAKSLKKDPWKYFRKIRIHELYHWSHCMVHGPDRFFVRDGLMRHNKEEMYANAMEYVFDRTQLGEVAAVKEDYKMPLYPSNMPEGSLPDPKLHKLPWTLANFDGLIQWPMASGKYVFVNVAKAETHEYEETKMPNYDLPGQHIPPHQPLESHYYFYNAVIYQGHYIGFNVFELTKLGMSEPVLVKSWWDEGLLPVLVKVKSKEDGKVWKKKKGETIELAPDNPVYTGKWVERAVAKQE